MLTFKFSQIIPPGSRYFYVVPDTETYFEDLTMRGLLSIVRRHYEENELEAPSNLAELIEDYICRNIPEGFCTGDIEGRPRARVFTLKSIQKATSELVSGNGRVIPGEARRRNLVCGRCVKNDRSMCPSCVGLVSWARRLVGTDLGAADDWVGICTVDGAVIAAKVHLKDIPDNEEYPVNCWRTEHD